ncbi:MAG: plastocyanin/azurin family copper-binding protein [Planctomycetota bacterium]
MKASFSLAAALLCAGLASAQTTHDVSVGPQFDFLPANVTIDVGDTVRWTWAGPGLHDVKSGVGGIVDGIFDSGNPVVAPSVFEVTFDSAFLAANPVPNNVYDYFCSIHVSFGMIGTVTVNNTVQPVVTAYGCANPVGSLVELSGQPVLGQTWTLGVDNPVPGGQPIGSLAFLAASLNPAPGFPCGLPLAGFHMDPAVATGELLIGLTAPDPVLSLGPVIWTGTGQPAAFPIPVPPTPPLAGVELHFQGLIVDSSFVNTFGATDGLRVTIGS